MKKYYVLFPNHYNGIKLNDILQKSGIKTTIAPTPRELSNCCGISLVINEEDITEVEQIIAHEQIEIIRIVSVNKRNDLTRDRFS